MLPHSSVAKKLLMAATGQLMILYVIAHALGNTTIHFGTINAYAAALHALPLLLGVVRAVMAAVLLFHAAYGILITLENRAARPDAYAAPQRYLAATPASRSMIWTGLAIAAFLVYHLLHFTLQVVDPSLAAATHPDSLGRPDVQTMVVSAFQRVPTTLPYAAGLAALWLHLSQGIQSSFQTFGLNNDRTFRGLRRGGAATALAVLLTYAAIPASAAMGLLRRLP